MTTKHTPIPYFISGESYGNYITVAGANNRVVCRIPWGKPDTEYDGETAKFIVLACNAHEMFKRTLERIASSNTADKHSQEIAIAAIAKARGEK